MSVNLRFRKVKKGYSLYLDIYKDYKRQYEYLEMFVSQDYSKVRRIKDIDKEKMELADKIRLKRELAFKSDEHGFIPKHVKNTDFYTFFEQVSINKKKENNSSYSCTLIKLKDFFGGSKLPVKNLTEKNLQGFLDYLSNHLSENTAFHYMRIVNAVFNLAIKERILTTNPFYFMDKELFPKRQKPERVFLTIEELRALSGTPFNGNEHIKWVYLFCCYTGLRIGDATKLRWSDIDENNWRIGYRQEKSKMDFHYLPLHESAVEILQSFPRHDKNPLVFWNFPSSKSYGNMLIRIWAATAGIKKHLTWHTGRHTYACLLLSNGVGIYTVSKLLGHSSVSITEVYGHLLDEKKDEAVNMMPKL
ncbi:MAG: site-specific integrase [Flavobacteriales bacterium]|nr:site-specific integrase [Flavobacteriales bacterium]